MNIENKKTALDDDAAIYQRTQATESAKSERQKLSELTFRGKMRYLWDYYALKAFIGLAVAGILIAILVLALKPRPEVVTYVSFLDCPWADSEMTAYAEELLDTLQIDKSKNEISIDTKLSAYDSNDRMALSTYLYANTIDILLCSRDTLEQMAQNGALIPLDSLPEDILTGFSADEIVVTHVTNKNAEDQTDHPYGLCLADSAFAKRMDPEGEYDLSKLYIGVSIVKDVRREDTINVVRLMLGKTIPKQ